MAFLWHCALPASSLLCLAVCRARFAPPSVTGLRELQGPDGRVAGGSLWPVPGDPVCTLCPKLAPWNDTLCNRQVHPHGHKEGWQAGSFLFFGRSFWPQIALALRSDASERQMGLTLPLICVSLCVCVCVCVCVCMLSHSVVSNFL